MLHRNSRSLFWVRLCGVVSVLSALLGVLGVLGTYLLGATRTPTWLYSVTWPYATQILIGAILCSLVGTVLLLYPTHITPLEGAGYELW